MRHPIQYAAVLLATYCGCAIHAGAQSYTYDSAGRLARVAYPNGRGVVYIYDNADNLLSATGLVLPAAPTGVEPVRVSPTSVKLTWDSVGGAATGVVIMRREAGGTDWVTLATVPAGLTSYVDNTVLSGTEYEYRIAAQSNNGLSAYSREATPSSASAMHLAVAALGAKAFSTAGDSATVKTGYAMVDVSTGSTPYGTAVFSFTQNGIVVSEAGVPASPPTRHARIFVDSRAGFQSPSKQFAGSVTIATGVAVVNTAKLAAKLTLTLRDGTGRTIAAGQGLLAAAAHFAGVLSDLPRLAADFVLPPDFSTKTYFGTLTVESDQPISVLALRATTNQRGDILFTTTPVADLDNLPAATAAYLPQFADGGGFSTSIFLVNPTDRPENGSVEFFNDQGAALTVKPADGSAAASSFQYSIPAGGVYVLESDGTAASVSAGWVRITPGFSQTAPAAGAAFRVVSGGILVSDAGVASAVPTTRARLYVDNSNGHDTGIAIANPGSSGGTIQLTAYAIDGKTPAGSSVPTSLTLDSRQHRANVARDLIQGIPAGFTGLMEVSSSTPFVALTLRALINSRGDLLFATFPNADLTRPAPEPVIFPHIADGGGFRTEFILLGPVSAADTTVRLLDEAGSPLPVGKVQ